MPNTYGIVEIYSYMTACKGFIKAFILLALLWTLGVIICYFKELWYCNAKTIFHYLFYKFVHYYNGHGQF